MDLCGPMSVNSLGDNKYFYLIVDDYSMWCWVYFLKSRMVVEMARSLLKNGHLPVKFWGEAVSTTVYLINRVPTQALQNKTSYKALHVVKPSVSHLKVFGCIAFALISAHKLHKLDEKSEKCVFIVYALESKAYRLYNPVSCKVIVSRDVVFHEGCRWSWDALHGKELVVRVHDDCEESEDVLHDTKNIGNAAEEAGESLSHLGPVSVNERMLKLRLLTGRHLGRPCYLLTSTTHVPLH